ncbi:TPA: hypothetical protein ACKRJ1_002517 [Pseudomonas aeruginosa]
MTAHKTITPEELMEYLDQETNSLLLANNVYDIGNYGWQSEDTEDPDYIGHAMWQISPPFETEWEYLMGTGPVRHRPSEKEKLLTVVGNDFEGLMRASRMSIGLCLLHKSIAEQKPFDDNRYFWLHYTDAMLQLNMASDRIRDYFIASIFDQTSEEYKKKGRNNSWYVAPFNEAKNHYQEPHVEASITNAIAPLPALANEIYSFRELRNETVHKIATKLGKMHKELIERQQQDYDTARATPVPKEKLDYAALRAAQDEANEKHTQELSTAANMIINWYKILVKFSSNVFESEHRLRKSKASA